jgi:hypothetical protein
MPDIELEKQVRNCSDCSVEMESGEINLKIDSDNYGFVVPFLPITYVAGDSLPVIVYTCLVRGTDFPSPHPFTLLFCLSVLGVVLGV